MGTRVFVVLTAILAATILNVGVGTEGVPLATGTSANPSRSTPQRSATPVSAGASPAASTDGSTPHEAPTGALESVTVQHEGEEEADRFGHSGSAWEGPLSGFECLEIVPAAAGLAGVTDDGRTVALDVLVLVDRMEGLMRARYLMRQAAEAFKPLDIDLNPHFQLVELRGSDSHDLLEQARVAAKAFPLNGIDVVHVITSADLVYGGNRRIAGEAYCIGGVRFKSDLKSISISEAWYEFEEARVGLPQAHVVARRDTSALIVAHEIGHLLGAHHHYGNCGENFSAAAASERREVAPCTVMDQTLFYSSARFGQLEGAVVRGHAVEYASS